MLKTTQMFALACLLAFAYLFTWHHLKDVSESDPDRYFHLALARDTAEKGLLRTVPQVEDIGWGKRFVEKNFLFTALTAGAHYIGGEKAVNLITPFLGVCFITLLFLLFCRFLPPLFSALLILAALCTPEFSQRLILLRPHLMALSFFFIFLFGLLEKNKAVTAIALLLYSLSYHATYIPLSALLIALVLDPKSKENRNLVLAGAVGLIVGVIINPYFPYNVFAGSNSFRIALNISSLKTEDRPIELIPLRTDDFLKAFGFYLILLGTTFYFTFKKRGAYLVLFLLSLLFWGLTCVTRRACEYAVPLTLFTAASAYAYMIPKRVYSVATAALFIALLSWPGYLFYKTPVGASIPPEFIFGALEKIPHSPGKKVFNCTWDDGSFVYYSHPEMRFVDLSDPFLLLSNSPDLHQLRQDLRSGRIAQPYLAIRDNFRSDYVLCDNNTFGRQLETDPFFKRIYPEKLLPKEERPMGYTLLFEPISDSQKFFLQRFTIDGKTYQSEPRVPYIDMFRVAKSLPVFSETNGEYCATVLTEKEEVEGHLGTKLLGIGGGNKIEVWLNQTPVISYISSEPGPRSLNLFVPLPRAVEKGDQIKAKVCANHRSRYMGLSLSLWNLVDIENTCRLKNAAITQTQGDWLFASGPLQTCLGPVATKHYLNFPTVSEYNQGTL